MNDQIDRSLLPSEKADAQRLRYLLALQTTLHPTANLSNESNLAIYETNLRAALPPLIAALDRTDLVLVYEIVRYLAFSPRPADLFQHIAARDHRFLVRMGLEQATA